MTTTDVELPSDNSKIILTKELDVVPNPKGFAHELFIHMKKHADAVAQMDAETEEADTFEILLKRCVRVALHLKKRGILPGDIVSPCTTNHLNTTVAMVAPLLVGAKIACMDPFVTSNDIREIVNLVKPKLMFICKEVEDKIEHVLEDLQTNVEIVVFGDTRKHTPFNEFLKPFPREDEDYFAPFEVSDLTETAVMVFSSGSTGVPKGICFDQYSVLYQLQRMLKSSRSNANSVQYSSLAWASTQTSIAASILSGTCKLICSKFDPAKAWNYLVKYDVKILALSPADAITLLRYGSPDKLETPNLKILTITDGKISPDNMIALQKLFSKQILVISPYEQSEIYGPILSYINYDVLINKPETSGLPLAGFSYKVVDPKTGNLCRPNEHGEIYLKSKYCMKGYYERDSSECFDEDGFLKTGDLGYYDENHFFYVIERISDVIKYQNNWIASTTLEAILYKHPAVKIACIIGMPSEEGDIVMGVVNKMEWATDVVEQDLIQFFNEKVDEHNKLRGGIIFVDEFLIPFTPTGKIRKFLLCKTILEDLEDLDLSINVF